MGSSKRGGGRRSGNGRRRVETETITNLGPVSDQCQVLEDGQGGNQAENLRGLEGGVRHVERFEDGQESVERGEGDLQVADVRQWVAAHHQVEPFNARKCPDPTTLFYICVGDLLRAMNR